MILLSHEVCASVAWHHSEYLGAQWVFQTTVLMSGENILICFLLFCIFLRKKCYFFVLLHFPFVPCERGGEQLGFFIRVIKQPSYKGSNLLCAQTHPVWITSPLHSQGSVKKNTYVCISNQDKTDGYALSENRICRIKLSL